MDSQDQHQQPQPEHGGNVTTVNNAAAAPISCKGGAAPPQIGVPRQTSTRWTPTAEQVRILRDLYYNYGVRSPNAEQIQRISTRLGQFGKIEGKNVFYWFQNHKARERQKKRLASDPAFHHAQGITSSAHYGAMLGSGQMGGYRYGSVSMEKKFTECSLSASSGSLAGQRVGWPAMDYALSSYCNALGNRYHRGGSKPPLGRYPQEEGEGEEDGEKEDDDNDGPEMETLPLFPMRDDEYSGGSFFGISPSPNPATSADPGLGPAGGGWHGDVVLMAKPRASLELSLSSCTGTSPASF